MALARQLTPSTEREPMFKRNREKQGCAKVIRRGAVFVFWQSLLFGTAHTAYACQERSKGTDRQEPAQLGNRTAA